MLLGVHVSIAGKIYESVDRAKRLGCNTFQIFSRNPRSWQKPTFNISDIEEFIRREKAADISCVVIHIPYLINLASPDEGLWRRSIKSFVEDIKNADALGAEYFVTHLGSHKGAGEKYGIDRFAKAINIITKEVNPKTEILLENTSGHKNSLGYRFEHLNMLMDRIHSSRIGICLDTAHTFEAGYPLHTRQGLNKMLREFDRFVGLDKLKVIHLNDSKSEFNSHHDRHWHIGKGKIGIEPFKRIINHPSLCGLPFILETPKKTERDDKNNLKIVRALNVRLNECA